MKTAENSREKGPVDTTHISKALAQMNLDTGAIFVTYPKTDAAADHFYNPVLLVTSWLIALLITLVSQKRDFL